MKSMGVVDIWVKFHMCLICIFLIFNVQVFSNQQDISFQAVFGMFLDHNSPKCGQIRRKYRSVMPFRAMSQICYSLYLVLKNGLKLGTETDFVCHFQRFFVYALLRPVSYTQIFRQKKGLIEIHNPGKFHHYTISGCQVIDFQMFPQEQKAQFLAASGWFFKDYSPK